MLIVFAGLPGTGKTTISRQLAQRLGMIYLRIDTIEQAIKSAGATNIGAGGYVAANALAADNLRLGFSVVADCVNPVRASRDGWAQVASRASASLVDILVICSDTTEHRQRVERRRSDIPGLVVPTWQDVLCRAFEPFDDAHLTLDTAQHAVTDLVERCVAFVEKVVQQKDESGNPASLPCVHTRSPDA